MREQLPLRAAPVKLTARLFSIPARAIYRAIAAIHAGLKLTPDQEKLWPPVEAAARDFAKMRIDRANARMKAQSDNQQNNGQPQDDDPLTRLRQHADNMAATAAALKKIADAADPLYKTLDEAQKRRLAVLTRGGRFGGGEGWRHRWMDRGMGRDDRNPQKS